MSFTTLRMACPGRNCTSKYKTNNWTHHECGGVIDINDDAELRCRSCFYQSNVFRWGTECEHHTLFDSSQLPTIDSISAILAMSTELTDAMGLQWYRRLLKNLLDSAGS